MWLCGFYYEALRVESCLAFCLSVVSVLFSIVITSLGEEGAVYVFLVHLFVYFARVNFCPFFFLLVSGVIVTTVLFYYLFKCSCVVSYMFETS